jgi:hypothetical protein
LTRVEKHDGIYLETMFMPRDNARYFRP